MLSNSTGVLLHPVQPEEVPRTMPALKSHRLTAQCFRVFGVCLIALTLVLINHLIDHHKPLT